MIAFLWRSRHWGNHSARHPFRIVLWCSTLMSCHRTVQNKNSFWSSVSHYPAWLPLTLPLVSFSLLFCKLSKQGVRGTGQCLQTQSGPLGCCSCFLMWCCGRDLTPNKWWELQASVLDTVCSNPRNSIAIKILHWMQGNQPSRRELTLCSLLEEKFVVSGVSYIRMSSGIIMTLITSVDVSVMPLLTLHMKQWFS